jgi:glutathione S-transferase
VAVSLYYEDQKEESARAAKSFREERIPKFLGYFENVLERSNGDWLTGARWSYADLSLFQLVEGLRYAFPSRMSAIEADHANVVALATRVADLPELADYLGSERRMAFNQDGIFRHYPELDGD